MCSTVNVLVIELSLVNKQGLMGWNSSQIKSKVFFSRKSDSTIANVCPSVCLSVTETPQPLRIAPIQVFWSKYGQKVCH